MIRGVIGQLVEGRDLTREEAAGVLGVIMEGQATPAQIAALLVALRIKGETVAEITGAVEAMRGRMQTVACDDPNAIDTCGTGGDGAGTFNVSTAVAFVAAGAGVTVAKHGNHGVSSGCGSADVLARAGFDLDVELDRVERSLREARLAFLYAPRYHPAVRHAVAPRREIGLRTLFNAMGPLSNPARVRRQVMGVYDAALVRPITEALAALGAERAFVVHGAGGLDEISPEGETLVGEVADGRIVERRWAPEDFGLSRWPIKAMRGGDATANLLILEELLDGKRRGAMRDMVLLNAAAAIHVAGRAAGLSDGVERARHSIDEGNARQAFDRARAINRGEG